MTEAIEQAAIRKSALDETHHRLGAEMVVRDDWFVPANYGDVLLEYAASREGGAGLFDLSARGRILVRGSEAVQFLNGLITNDMKTLAEHQWMPAAFPNVQGRLIASVRVVRLEDEATEEAEKAAARRQAPRSISKFLIETETATHQRVMKTIERFTLAGDFQVLDVSAQTALLTVQGKKSAEIIRLVLGETSAGLGVKGALQTVWQGSDLMLIRGTHTGEDGFDLIVNSESATGLWDALQAAGARPAGHDALEMLRIEAGIPRYGIDMDESNVVTEAGLDDAVSYTKGCYVGQEIIARIKYRGHVAKKLSGLKFDRAVKVAAGTAIKSVDDKEIGRLTSSTYSPHLGRTIGLGYLKYDYLAPGTPLKIMSEQGDFEATVVALPFVSRATT